MTEVVTTPGSGSEWAKVITWGSCYYEDGASFYDSTDNTIYALYGIGPVYDLQFIGFDSSTGDIKYVNLYQSFCFLSFFNLTIIINLIIIEIFLIALFVNTIV